MGARNTWLFAAAVLATSAVVAADEPAECLEIDPSRWSWQDYEVWSRHYAHCDDGENASTLDWFVTHKLAREWRSLPQLAELIASAPALKVFVLRHVGYDASARDVVQLRRNAQRACPARFSALCRELAAATELPRSSEDELLDALRMGDYWHDDDRSPGPKPRSAP